MSFDKTGVPDIADELDRKSMLTLEYVLSQESEGQIPTKQALYACRVIFDITSGITDRSVHDLISESVEYFESKIAEDE